MVFIQKVKGGSVVSEPKREPHTPPIAEIIWVKNVRAIVVCGFLMK